MKTILLTLFVAGFGCGLWAQTTANGSDADSRDAILRRALRAAIAGDTNPVSAPVAPAVSDPSQATGTTIVKPAPAVPAPSAPVPTGENATTAAAAVSAAAAAPATPSAPADSAASLTIPAPAAEPQPAPATPVTTTAPAAVAPVPVPVVDASQQPGNAAQAAHPAGLVPPNRRGMRPGVTGPAGMPPTGFPQLPSATAGTVPQPGASVPTPSAMPTLPPSAQSGAGGADVSKSAEQIIAPGEINFPAVDLNQVLQIYAELVGRTVLRPSALGNTLITLKTQTPLTKTEAIQALDSVLAMNGITMINVGDKFVKAVPVAQAGTAGAAFNSTDYTNLPEADQYVTHIVQLKYSKPSEVVPILTPLAQIPGNILAVDSNNMLIIRDYAANVKRMLELINQIDVNVPSEFDMEVIPIKYALATDISSALSSIGGGGGGTSIGHSAGGAGASGSRLSSPGSSSGGLGTPGSSLNSPGSPGYTAPGTSSPGGASRTSSFTDRLQAIVKKAAGSGDFQVLGQTKIIADERTNSLLVFADKADMAMIKKVISQLDVVLAQVLIEAVIMEVSLDDQRDLGVSYLQNSPSKGGNYFTGIGAIKNGPLASFANFAGTATNAAGGLPSGFSYLANFGNDFNATITAAASDSRINVLSRPRIQTSHAVTASLEIGDTVPYVTGTYFGGINGQASSQYQQTFVGINLQVTPLINPDGLVVMDIVQDIQQLGTPVTIDNNPVPTTTKRTAQAKVSVRDRDTIILGGFISTTKSKTKSGVPILKDIPGLGYLFRSTSDSNKRVELIVLIRPTVLPTPEAAALVATHERDKLPGIKAAEAENERDEAKRQKAADKLKVNRDSDNDKKAL